MTVSLVDGSASILREQALAHLIEAKDILVRADQSARDLTAAEVAEVERHTTASERLTAQYQAHQAAAAATPRERPSLLDMRTGLAVPYGGPGGRNVGRVLADGIRVMGKADRFADLVASDAPGHGLSIADVARSLLTGADIGIPLQATAPLGGGAGGGAAAIVPAPISADLIDIARAASRCVQAGATVVPMTTSTLRIPRKLVGTTPDWKAENAPASIVDSLAFDAVTLTAKTLVGFARASIELFEDVANMQQIVSDDLGAALAQQLDLAALRGAVTNPQTGPVGLRYTPGVEVEPGTATSYADISLAVQRCREDNIEPNAAIYSPQVAGILDRLVDSLYNPLTPPESWRNLLRLPTAQAGEDELYVGRWSDLVIGVRTEMVLEASRFAGDGDTSAWTSGQVWLRAYLRADVQVTRTNAFQVLTGLDEEGS